MASGPGVLSPPRFPAVASAAAHYESFYLKACHPDGGLGAWIRYTVHKRPDAPPKGSLWFTLFDASRGLSASKVEVLGPAAAENEYIRLGEAHLAPGFASGHASSEQLVASWELRFQGTEPPLRHLPAAWMYRAPLPRTKVLTPHPRVTFDGRIQAGARTVEVERWPGMIGHNWGSEHAHRAIWLHGTNFAGAEEAWLDLAVGRIKVAGLTTPWIANGAIHLEGRRFRLGGLRGIRSTSIQETPESCHFRLGGEVITVEGHVRAPHEHFVSWIYAQPRGGERQTVNCSIADMQLDVSRPGRPSVALEVRGGAAYELQMQERYEAIPPQPFADG